VFKSVSIMLESLGIIFRLICLKENFDVKDLQQYEP
jgi:hypothetical protein